MVRNLEPNVPSQTVAYLEPHHQGQVLKLCRLAVSIIQPPEHVSPISHFHVLPGLLANHRTGKSFKGFKQNTFAEISLLQFIQKFSGTSLTSVCYLRFMYVAKKTFLLFVPLLLKTFKPFLKNAII